VQRPSRRRFAFLVALLVATALGLVFAWRVIVPSGTDDQPTRPIVILVSIDGMRWDYFERYSPATLGALARAGVRAEGLIPVFPSKTFPNHYSIVTGLYPGRHGIVSNNMLDPALPGRFTLGTPVVQQNTRWWGGEPIWVTVERQGQFAGTMFWPGSDVEIAGDRPQYWQAYSDAVSNEMRVAQILSWLQRRADSHRPTLLTLYFSDVDSAGHNDGPESSGVERALTHVDAMIGRLVEGVARARLSSVVNYIIVSDHGMAALSKDRTIVLNDYLDVSTVDVVDWSPILGIRPRTGTVDDLYRALAGKHPSLQVYRSAELPPQYRLAGHPRMPPIIAVADDGWHIMERGRRVPGGAHGYDPTHRSMHGVFIASGPAFKSNVVVPAFENVHVYELMCRVLGVKPASNDGDLRVTEGMLK
jgi:predicted AlkP superfamily pyrophosphatase or phosphodiesterase